MHGGTKLLQKMMACFDLESVFVKDEELKDTETKTRLEIFCPVSVSTSPNLVEDPTNLCKVYSGGLVSSFFDDPEFLPHRKKRKKKFPQLKKLYEANLHRFSKLLINVAFMDSTSKGTARN